MSDKNNSDFDENNLKINPNDEKNVKNSFFNTLKKAAGQVPYSKKSSRHITVQ